MITILYEINFHEGKISINWDEAKNELQIAGENGRTTIAFEYVWEVCPIDKFAQNDNFQRVVYQYFGADILSKLKEQIAQGLK